MNLRQRLDRLEGATVKAQTAPIAIVREIVKPSATGPELVGLMLRPLHCGETVQINRAPDETEAEMRVRFKALRNGLTFSATTFATIAKTQGV